MAKIVDWDTRIGKRVRLRDLHILLSVVQCGSMAKAAAQLGVSQPAVSEAIAGLERTLDVRLLDRGRRGIEPTTYGLALLNSSKAAFEELRQGIKQIEFLADPTAGELRIACAEQISAGILGPIIKLMSERYPRVRLWIEPSVLRAKPLFPQLDSREVDLVMVTRSVPSPARSDIARAVNIEILFNDRHCVVVGKNGPWARRRKIDLADLAGEPWIAVPSDGDSSGGAVILANAFRARGLEPPRVAVTTYSVHLRNSLAATSRFVAVLPESVLRFNTDNLRALPIALPTVPWPVIMVTLRNRTANPVVDLFIGCAREVVRSYNLHNQ